MCEALAGGKLLTSLPTYSFFMSDQGGKMSHTVTVASGDSSVKAVGIGPDDLTTSPKCHFQDILLAQ